MHILNLRRRAPLGIAALLLTAAVTGCGSDGGIEAEAPSTTTEAETAETFDPDATGEEDEDAGPAGGEDQPAEDEQAVIDLDDDQLSEVLNELVQEITPLPSSDEDGPPATTVVEDQTGTLAFEAPEGWDDVRDVDETRDEPFVAASPDFDEFAETWDAPAIALYETGLATETSREAYEQYVDGTATETGNLILDECDEAFDATWERDEVELTIAYFDDCGGTTTDFAIVWAVPEGGPVLAVDAQLVEQSDLVALSLALDSLELDGRRI